MDTVSFDSKVARNAGFPFEVQGLTIRPAQDCTRFYGSCVVLQEMAVEQGGLKFRELRRFHSPRFAYSHAFHTFNVFQNKYIAVDAEGFRHGLLAQLIFKVRESFKK